MSEANRKRREARRKKTETKVIEKTGTGGLGQAVNKIKANKARRRRILNDIL